MDDIFEWCKKGNALRVRVWLEDTSHDINQGDDHGFSPLHWSAFYGHNAVVDLLLSRGAQINATNTGRDTALHLASAHGHKDVVHMLLKNNADINAVNQHGNTPLHYACFWGYQEIAEELINSGAVVGIANKYRETALDKCKGNVKQKLLELAEDLGQDLGKKIQFRDQPCSGSISRTRNATLSRNSSLNRNELDLKQKISTTHSGETWRGIWRKSGDRICAKFLVIRGELTPRILSDFSEEYQRLRIFSHPNVLPVIGCVDCPPNLIVVNQYMPYGSLYHILHESTGVVVDTHQAIKFAIDIARGMAFLHTLKPLIPRFHLSSKHVMIDEDLTARINMANTKFSFQDRNKVYNPSWMSPEALLKKPADISVKAADMWSFSILLWELVARQVPFADLSPMEIGMKIALEALRVAIPPGISPHMARLIKICMNEEPGKRPTFDQVIPILDKMKISE